MALFEKLFSTKRKLDGHRQSRDYRSCQITPKQVRLLLFKECDWRGRKLLFDSSTIEKVPAGKDHGAKQTDAFPCVMEVAEGFAYVYKGPAADASVLGEMIFGAVAMSCKGVSLKIHIMDEPKRLMCTKVFCVPKSRRISRAERKTEHSAAELQEPSTPLNVPLQKEEVSLSFSIDRGDSGFYGDQTPHSSIDSTYDYFSMFDVWDGNNTTQPDMFYFHSPSGRKLSTSSNGSWHRRTFRNIATRFDLGNSSNLLTVPSASTNTDSQVYSNSSTSGTTDSLGSTCAALKKNKLGLALLISVPDSAEKDFIRRCVEMSPQLQSMVCRLRLATMTAGAGGNFIATLHRAAIDAAGWLSQLLSGPRLQPTWLLLVNSEPPRSHKMADSLLADLCAVLAYADTKDTNFFISTLVTHVLTYHLGWVSTVSPYEGSAAAGGAAGAGGVRRPHNALWAQLAALRGAVGCPPRAARTVVSGAERAFVNRLLLVLTYFIRCGDVVRGDFQFDTSVIKESETVALRTARVPEKCEVDVKVNGRGDAPAPSRAGLGRSSTLADLGRQLSTSIDFGEESRSGDKSAMRRNPTMMLAVPTKSSDSSLDSTASEDEVERKVVFVLGDDEKLVGLKNKSNGGKSVKKSSKIQHEPPSLDAIEKAGDEPKESCDQKPCEQKCSRSADSPSKCCAQTLQHSKPIKHSGFKFEFDKYPQIVTNYMKSKNLEILDRHYIGKPGNLKLDNFQFDPTIVPAIQEERCEACYKCQMMESMLQTPTNASELEYMNDVPRQSDPQYAKESIVSETDSASLTKTFVRRKMEGTLVVNVKPSVSVEVSGADAGAGGSERDRREVRQVLELAAPRLARRPPQPAGLAGALLGGLTDQYVPDLILQGTISKPRTWEVDLRRDLDVASYLNKGCDAAGMPVAIVGDTDAWEVRVVGREAGGGGGGGGGMSALVGAMLDALPAMRRARVPAYQCLTYLEGKLREFCVLSKTLADMLMSTDFCDIATLTKSLNIDVNDVPLLLAIATTHTPQVAARYGISYR